MNPMKNTVQNIVSIVLVAVSVFLWLAAIYLMFQG